MPTPSTSQERAPSRSEEPVEGFAATGIDDALEMLSIVNAKTDKASVGQDAAKLEAHPEVRSNYFALCLTSLTDLYHVLCYSVVSRYFGLRCVV